MSNKPNNSSAELIILFCFFLCISTMHLLSATCGPMPTRDARTLGRWNHGLCAHWQHASGWTPTLHGLYLHAPHLLKHTSRCGWLCSWPSSTRFGSLYVVPWQQSSSLYLASHILKMKHVWEITFYQGFRLPDIFLHLLQYRYSLFAEMKKIKLVALILLKLFI